MRPVARLTAACGMSVAITRPSDVPAALKHFENGLAVTDDPLGQASRSATLRLLGRTEEARTSGETAESLQPRALSAAIGSGEDEESGGGMHMLIGALFFFGGLIATIYTYTSAASGGTYSISWGRW